MDGRTDGPTDGRADGQTDGRTDIINLNLPSKVEQMTN